jgi:hypothetical protein
MQNQSNLALARAGSKVDLLTGQNRSVLQKHRRAENDLRSIRGIRASNVWKNLRALSERSPHLSRYFPLIEGQLDLSRSVRNAGTSSIKSNASVPERLPIAREQARILHIDYVKVEEAQRRLRAIMEKRQQLQNALGDPSRRTSPDRREK